MNCPAKVAYLKDKSGENFIEHKNYNRDRDSSQSGQTSNKPTPIPAPGQQKSQYQPTKKPSTAQNKNNKPNYNNNR